MAEAKWEKKCSECDATVKYGAFGPCKSQPGNHTVEAKTYYHLGARDIQDVRDRRKFGPLIILEAAYTRVDPMNPDKRDMVPGLSVKFEHGRYSTSDPAEQFLLDRKGFPTGEEGLRMWRSIYLTPEQNAAQAVAEAKEAQGRLDDLNRQVREANDLLTKTKAEGKSGGSKKPEMVGG